MMRGVIRVMVLAVVCLASFGVLGDTIRLKDGRVFEGRVLKETRTSVEFEALVSNITTVMTFRKREIESIERGEVVVPARRDRAGTPERSRGRTTSRRPSASPGGDAVRYLEIPLEGTFGEDIAPEGVRDALDFAKKRKIEHVVFRLKSPGGYVWAANEIADVMSEFHEGLRYYCVIEEAISASIWVVFGCDEIFALPDARVGAAVVFSQDRTTGEAEVDAKMNSAIAGTLAARAHANGHSPEIVRAMVLQEAQVFAIREGEVYRFTDQLPDVGHEVLDTSQTVLTMTSDELVRYGVARPLADDGALGNALGHEGWTRFNNYGSASMRKAAQKLQKEKAELERLLGTVGPLVAAINSAIEEVNQYDPRMGSYSYYEDSGGFTSQSLREWRSRTETTIGAWERAIDGCQKLRYIMKKCEEHGVDFEDETGGGMKIDAIELEKQGRREIQWLRDNINRNSF
ncbi:MAG: hypothetical protein ACF8GE_08260 [Phycisphaerales bacterium JB043]